MSYKLVRFSRWFLVMAMASSLVFGFGRAGAQNRDGGALGDRYILTFQNIAATPETWSVLVSLPGGSAIVEELMGAAVQLDFDSFQIEPLEFGAYIQAIVALVGDPNDFRIAIYNEDGDEIYTASVEEGTVELLPELADEFRAGIGLGGYSAEDFADFNLDDYIDIEDEGFVMGAVRQGIEAVQGLLGIGGRVQFDQQEGAPAASRPIAPGSSAQVSPTGQVSFRPGATDAAGRPVTSLTPGVGGTTGGFSATGRGFGSAGGGNTGSIGQFVGGKGLTGGGVPGAPGFGGQGGSTNAFSSPFGGSFTGGGGGSGGGGFFGVQNAQTRTDIVR